MPLYHFRCSSCNVETEQRLSFGSTDTPTCEACKKKMIKIMRPPVVHFKGSGFYRTDSSKTMTSNPKESTTSKAPESPPAEPAETKATAPTPTETKAEPATPTAPKKAS